MRIPLRKRPEESASRASASQSGQPHSKLAAVATVLMVVIGLGGVIVGAWAAWEARRNNDMSDERPPNSVKLTSPQLGPGECAPVRKGESLELRGTAELADGTTLWEITQAGGDNRLWPGPTAEMAADGRSWSMTISSIGAANDKGGQFRLLIVAADPNAAPQLRAAASAKNYQALPELPTGTTILNDLCVKRTS